MSAADLVQNDAQVFGVFVLAASIRRVTSRNLHDAAALVRLRAGVESGHAPHHGLLARALFGLLVCYNRLGDTVF